MAKLAIRGGAPLRTRPFPVYNTIGPEEKRAAVEVIESGVLSGYLGTWSPQFYGGPRVQTLEREWAAYFGVRHAVSVNSATSGLYAAIGAAGVGPGDEVIVTPYTMSASATAALVYGAVPVFADIDPTTYCLDPARVEAAVSTRTRAIVAVDLFGQPADMVALKSIADRHRLVLIEDAAQAAGAMLADRHAGTLGHIGVYSLNYHKVIHSGEGGVVVTDDDRLAERLQLIRNHGEVVVREKGVEDLSNLVGFNYRMTEIEAAIALEQLRKLESLVRARVEAARELGRHLSGLAGLTSPAVREKARHIYYAYAMQYDPEVAGVDRALFVEALRAEGVPVGKGYVRPIYLEPLYQRRVAYGRDGFPFRFAGSDSAVRYERGLCPIAELMHFERLITTNICHASIAARDLADWAAAAAKVLENAHELRNMEHPGCARSH